MQDVDKLSDVVDANLNMYVTQDKGCKTRQGERRGQGHG